MEIPQRLFGVTRPLGSPKSDSSFSARPFKTESQVSLARAPNTEFHLSKECCTRLQRPLTELAMPTLQLVNIAVACNLRTCAVCRLHGAKYAVCRLHGTQNADCMVTEETKDPSKTCDSFSKFQRNLRFSARINFLTKLPNLKENNLCLFDNGYYSFSCL